jgi:hypothetical protein
MDRRFAFGALFCVMFGVAACTTGGGDVTSPNPLNPTPGPKASPTPVATSSAASETVPLPPNGGTISIPNFGDFTGTATTSALSVGAGATVTITDSTMQVASPPVPVPAGQTGVFFVELSLSETVTFTNANIPTTITSPSQIVPGATYTANVYALGGPVQAQQTAVASGHSVSFTIIVPSNGSGGGSFPGGVPADIVVSK